MLCASALALAVAPMVQPIAKNLHLNHPNVQKMEKIISKKLSKNKIHTSKICEKINNAGQGESFKIAMDYYQKHLNNNNLELVIYRNDTLLFWSSNVDFTPDTATSRVRILKKESHFYLSQCVKNEQFRLVFLVGFYADYPYRNKYLRSGFTPDFNFIHGYKVSTEPTYTSVPVIITGIEPFYLVPNTADPQNPHHIVKPLLQWAALAMLYLAVFTLAQLPFFKKRRWLQFTWLIGIPLGIRALCLALDFPDKSNSLLFDPSLFAHTNINPSLGDLLANSILLFVLMAVTYQFTVSHLVYKPRICKNGFWASLAAMGVWGAFAATDYSLRAFVLHSTLPLETYQIFELNIYSIVGYTAMAFVACTALLAAYTWVRMFYKSLKIRRCLKILLATFALAASLHCLMSDPKTTLLWGSTAILVMSTLMLCNRPGKKGLTFSWIILIISIIASYSVASISKTLNLKHTNIRKVLAINLSSERDPLAELLITQIGQRLNNNALVRHYVKNIETYNTELYEYLRKQYLKYYLNKYMLRATVCSPNTLIYNYKGQASNYNDYFQSLIKNYGVAIPGSQFFYLNKQNGTISYIGLVAYRFGNEQRNLYIELNSRPNWEILGYPELLIEGKNLQRKLYGYSYAKYHNNRLVNQGGDYPFALELNSYNTGTSTYNEFTQNGYHHLVYRSSPTDAIVVSRKLYDPLNIGASLIYSIAFFMLICPILLSMSRVPLQITIKRQSLTTRVKWAMALIIVLSMVLVAASTVIYSTWSFEQRNHKNLGEKILSVTQELYRDIPLLADIEKNTDRLTDRLVDLSNVFYSDINIYDTTGMLVVTSRPEIFDKDLMGERMNYQAWHAINFNQSQTYMGRESIGSIKFLSAYVPLTNARNKTVAYLNLPYFTKEEELSNELYSAIVAILNIYALLALFAFGITMAISAQITRPLELIRERIRRVDISGQNDPIEYSGNDEVGRLVGEYNRMVKELDHSAKELAKTQRESAWREMARQVAHEVKNPLTPIKLSLQHLVRAKKEKVANWDQLFERFAQSLEEQINTLAKIAYEFSSFAKLPTAKIADLDLNLILNDAMSVFAGYNDSMTRLQLINQTSGTSTICADRDQILRVFNNLILNAIQSIEKGKPGEIEVVLSSVPPERVRVEVIDNGCGIAPDVLPKLFNPNFTTKSSGTGLGLAIAREIVETFGGTIGVSNNKKGGSTFFVEFKTKHNNDFDSKKDK